MENTNLPPIIPIEVIYNRLLNARIIEKERVRLEKESGKQKGEVDKSNRWYSSVLLFDISTKRDSKGDGKIIYFTCYYIDEAGEKNQLNRVLFNNEINSGYVFPMNDIALASFQKRYPSAKNFDNTPIKVSDYNPSIAFRKYKNFRKTMFNEETNRPLPEFVETLENGRSILYMAQELRVKALKRECKILENDGMIYRLVPGKKSSPIDSIKDKFVVTGSENYNVGGGIQTINNKTLEPLLNPTYRINLSFKRRSSPKFSNKNGVPAIINNENFDPSEQGEINSNNIHLWLAPNGKHTGFINWSQVLFANGKLLRGFKLADSLVAVKSEYVDYDINDIDVLNKALELSNKKITEEKTDNNN